MRTHRSNGSRKPFETRERGPHLPLIISLRFYRKCTRNKQEPTLLPAMPPRRTAMRRPRLNRSEVFAARRWTQSPVMRPSRLERTKPDGVYIRPRFWLTLRSASVFPRRTGRERLRAATSRAVLLRHRPRTGSGCFGCTGRRRRSRSLRRRGSAGKLRT